MLPSTKKSLQMMETGVLMFQTGGSQLVVEKRPAGQDSRHENASRGGQNLFESIQIPQNGYRTAFETNHIAKSDSNEIL